MKSTSDEPPAEKSRRDEIQTGGPVVFNGPSELFLRVGADHVDEAVVFSVCPKALTRLSEVFAKMLNGGFAESRPAEKQQRWEIGLPDDKPASLRILMDIMHGRVHEVPKTMDLTDKHDVVHLLRPSDGWINSVKHQTNDIRLLGVAWYLKNVRVFSQMMNKITERSGLNENREMYFQYDGESGTRHNLSHLLNGFVPSRIIDQLPDLWRMLVSAVLQPYVDIVKSLLCLRYGALCPEKVAACDDIQLVLAVRGFFRKGINITLQKPGETYDGTVRSLKKALERIGTATSWDHTRKSI